MKWLRKLFRRKRQVTVPLVLEAPGEWTEADRKAWAMFLESGVGAKLKLTAMYDAQARALEGVERSVFEQGIDAGKNRMLGGLLALAQTDDAGDDDPADKE